MQENKSGSNLSNLCILVHVLVEPDRESGNVSNGNNVVSHCHQVHFGLSVTFLEWISLHESRNVL